METFQNNTLRIIEALAAHYRQTADLLDQFAQSFNPSSIMSGVDSDTSSIIFTRKAKREHKQTSIIQSLQKSIIGRKDKTRAFVTELKNLQKEEYVDAHFNAQVMYDELTKILPLPFGYEAFKKHYNNTRS